MQCAANSAAAADTLVVTDVTLGTPRDWKMGRGGSVNGNLKSSSVAGDESVALDWSWLRLRAAASTAAAQAAAAILECTPYKYLILLFHTAVGLKYRLSFGKEKKMLQKKARTLVLCNYLPSSTTLEIVVKLWCSGCLVFISRPLGKGLGLISDSKVFLLGLASDWTDTGFLIKTS